MNEDPIIAEIRKTRETHAAKFNYDLDLIVADIKQNEERLRLEGWRFYSPEKKLRRKKTAA